MPGSPSPPQDGTRTYGTAFTLAAWVLVLVLLTWLFGAWETRRAQPNRELASAGDEVQLRRSPDGHYRANGSINGHEVTFFVDTGATYIAIPAPVADRLGLQRLARSRSETAGGTVDTYLTRLDEVRLGPLVERNVPASINPHMEFGGEILLGMAFLKHLEIVQRGDTLTLRR